MPTCPSSASAGRPTHSRTNATSMRKLISSPRSTASVPEQLRKDGVQVDAPDLIVVPVPGALREFVGDLFVNQQPVGRAAVVDEGVIRAAPDPDQLVVLVRLRRIGQGLAEGVLAGGSAEDADVSEQFRMVQAD